jgi:HD superfamily phosphodiesterase
MTKMITLEQLAAPTPSFSSIEKDLLKQFVDRGDTATLEHSIRVSVLAGLCADFTGIDQSQKNLARTSGLLHDIGKLQPTVASLIHNGRSLTATERALVNRHARHGFDMLNARANKDASSLRARLGDYMAQVALDTLFSHSNARSPVERGIDQSQIHDLVEEGIITAQEAAKHHQSIRVQILTVADVTDALLSTGRERSYRSARFANEGRQITDNQTQLPKIINETVETPDIDVVRYASEILPLYTGISYSAHKIASCLDSTKTVIDLTTL